MPFLLRWNELILCLFPFFFLSVVTFNDLSKYQVHYEKGAKDNQSNEVKRWDVGVVRVHVVVHHAVSPVFKWQYLEDCQNRVPQIVEIDDVEQNIWIIPDIVNVIFSSSSDTVLNWRSTFHNWRVWTIWVGSEDTDQFSTVFVWFAKPIKSWVLWPIIKDQFSCVIVLDYWFYCCAAELILVASKLLNSENGK